MTDINNPEDIVKKIVEKTGKTEEEIKGLMETKKAKYSNLLTDAGAAFMIAKELGVNVGVDKIAAIPDVKDMKIKDITTDTPNINLKAGVKAVYDVRTTERNGEERKFCRMRVFDDTGFIFITFWNVGIDDIEKGKIKEGVTLDMKNVYVTEWQNRPQLNLSERGSYEISEDTVEVPIYQGKQVKVSGLQPDDRNLIIEGRISRIYPPKDINTSAGEQIKLLNFELMDNTGTVRVTAWREKADEMTNYKQNDLVKLENVYSKAGFREGVDLQMNQYSQITKLEKTDEEIPEVEPYNPDAVPDEKQKLIVDLAENDKNIRIRANITNVFKTPLLMNYCEKCNGRINNEDQSLACEACGPQEKTREVVMVALEIDDGSSSIRSVCYNNAVYSIFNTSLEEIKDELQKNDANAFFEKIKARVLGKELIFVGNTRINKMSNDLEFLINKSSSEIDKEKELEFLEKQVA